MKLGQGLKAQGAVHVMKKARKQTVLSVFTGLLDDYASNLVGWWGLKKRFTTYLGNCIRVRRDSDNAEENIPFDNETGLVDVTAIANFCGAANGFVVKIYDQSGNQRSLSLSIQSAQVQIYNGNTVTTLGGVPYMAGEGAKAYAYVGETSTQLGFTSEELSVIRVNSKDIQSNYRIHSININEGSGTNGIVFIGDGARNGGDNVRDLSIPLYDTDSLSTCIVQAIKIKSGIPGVVYHRQDQTGTTAALRDRFDGLDFDGENILQITLLGRTGPLGDEHNPSTYPQIFFEAGLWNTYSIDLATAYAYIWSDLTTEGLPIR